MEGINSRLIFSCLSGLFSLTLGLIALRKNPDKRLNRLFAAYNFFLAARFILPGLTLYLPYQSALISYRLSQACFPIYSFFLLSFVQDYAGIYRESAARRLRHITLITIAVLVPLYATPLMIKGFSHQQVGTDSTFSLSVGPAYFLNNIVFILLFTAAVATIIQRLRATHGLMRNQLMFMALGMGLGILAMVTYLVSRVSSDMALVYFPLQMLMNFCFAYAIFKYQLFEFDLWMRRIAIYSGVYIFLTCLPILFFFPLRGWLLSFDHSLWLFLCGAAIAYGVLYSLAPMVISFLRIKSEKALWLNLRSQLQFLKEASDTLASEERLSHQEIAVRVKDALTEFYWNRMKTPLSFIMPAISAPEGGLFYSIHPASQVNSEVLGTFFKSLQNIPSATLPSPFSLLDVSHAIDHVADPAIKGELSVLKNYLEGNTIELCVPCVHDGKFHGALLVGAKEKGIFMPEELTTLLTMAAQTALAVRKSELLISNQELTKLDELKQDLISNITHEFKSPVQVVENAIQIVLADIQQGKLDPAKISEYLLMIRNNNGRLGVFIQNLLDVAKIENSKVHLKTENTDLEKIVRDSLDLFRPSFTKKNIPLDFQSRGPMKARVDSEKIKQVACNLISNAIKFSDGRPILVTLESNGTQAVLQVKDSGRGLRAEEISSLFQKFFQAADSKHTNPEGTGLGLTIAKGWVEAHGGKIWAESAGLGKGTSFYVQIPLFPAMEAEEEWEEEAFG